MEQEGHQSADLDRNKESSDMLAEMGTDASFTATPLVRSRATSLCTDPTFMQDQIAIQRSASTAKDHVSELTKQLSLKSKGSQGQINKATEGEGERKSETPTPSQHPKSLLSKSPSNGSERSAKSVKSVHAVGSYPLGCLRVHSPSSSPPPSPSPSPAPASNKNPPNPLLQSGDVFIVRDVTGGSLFGYDSVAFSIKENENFDGVKAIPHGLHFFWGGSNKTSLRNGFWIISKSHVSEEYGAIHVKRWDQENEVLDEEVSKAEVRIQKEDLPEIYDKLQTYMIPTVNTTAIAHSAQPGTAAASDPNLWPRLVSSITGVLLNRITGNKGWNNWQVCSVHDHLYKTSPANNLELSMENHRGEVLLSNYRDEVLRFTFPQYKRTFSEESLGRTRTEQAMDSTSHILKIISTNCSHGDPDEIIGEVQFCFITGMLLGNVACMEQWSHVVRMVFGAYDLVLQEPVFFRKFIEAIHTQFIYDDEGLEGSILDHEPNLSDDLKPILTKFKARLNEMLLELGANISLEQSAVGKAFLELETWLWKWDWDLRANYVRSGKYQLEDGTWIDAELNDFQAEDERGEFAPVMVELDDNGREKGLIHF
ncbi:hypothetical protein HYALB_00000830 [Hymenoscyphus albidus]|uniref:Uncharacterized protein n=1 Tax=Hymenoscyphus albidus TaxID=595503 RepID=A0A9N9LDX3_9HELO|nr:hypothetical protein HYALB_00000830 [Hymenoscyphus albidus]